MIKLFDNWVIRVDEYNYILAKDMGESIDKDGKVRKNYKHYGFYSTLRATLKAFMDILSREELKAQESTLAEAVGALERNTQRLEELLKEVTE